MVAIIYTCLQYKDVQRYWKEDLARIYLLLSYMQSIDSAGIAIKLDFHIQRRKTMQSNDIPLKFWQKVEGTGFIAYY